MMKEIGGYLELELGVKQKAFFPNNAVYLNSGRNAFEYILKSLPKINTIWMPYFTCSSLQEPLQRLGVNVCYYHISEQLEIENLNDIKIADYDYLLYTNYFGVKEVYAQTLLSKFGNQLILDNSQALFAKPTELCFYSPRKFVGIPDGGVAFSPFKVEITGQDHNSYLRCTHLLKRFDYSASDGYSDFKSSSQTISNQPLQRMSNLTKKIFETIDLEKVKVKRNENFSLLHELLKKNNQLILEDISGALVYPFYNSKGATSKKTLIENKIYVATYWPNVLSSSETESVEYKLADLLVNIPIDQRWSTDAMFEIVKLITE